MMSYDERRVKTLSHLETQLLAWLREEPGLTQRALSERSGLTRSQVSRCLGSLIRQGLIP